MEKSDLKLIDIKNISFSYDLFPFKKPKNFILNNLSLKICAGDRIGIIGGNGTGKSTLLKIISGILLPDQGSITYKKNIHVSLLSLSLGYMPNLTGKENIEHSCLLLGLDSKKINKISKKIINFSGIGEKINQPLKTYSNGMRSRLGFSIAINIKSDILLLDEIISVGDHDFQQKCNKELLLLASKKNKAFIVVSHNLSVLEKYCNKLILIENGKIMKFGSFDEVRKIYASK